MDPAKLWTELERDTSKAFNEDFLAKFIDNTVGHYSLKMFTIIVKSFLNRVDDVIVFHQLSRVDLERIVALQLEAVRELLSGRNLSLELEPEAREFLVEQGYDPAYGARPLKRAIQRYVLNPLALAVLEGEFSEGDLITAHVAPDRSGLSFAGDRSGSTEMTSAAS